MRRRLPITLLLALGVALAGAAAADATDSAAVFDAPGQVHARVCVDLAGSNAPLRFGDSDPTGFSVTNAFSFKPGECPDGTVRLDLHEVIPTSASPLIFHRGGNGYVDDQNVKYGELEAADIADVLPDPVPSSGGRGAPCTLVDGPAYKAVVRSIPDQMHYKRPQDLPGGSNRGSSFLHYGDPGADQGDVHDIHYSYLIWSFLDVRGGGHVRTLLRPGQVVRPCDVEPLTMPSWDRAGNVNGQVTARYVRVLAGTCPLYGWMVWTHSYGSAAPVAHAQLAGSPVADPQPDAGCPVAAAAAPPDVTTGDAVPVSDAAWSLAGGANPKGVPTSYRFELGVDTGYGTPTATGSLASADRMVPVSTQVSGLQPGTTYHYRLVASNTHGTTYGLDRAFTTAPPPAPVVEAAAKPVTLSRLRLSPSAFRRARSRHGAATRITYRLSTRARVMLTFERRTARGHWVRVRGSLHQSARQGSNTMRFGGWLGRRALARGRYRLRALPTGLDGRHGIARRAGFSVRR
jgi:hypothetical protein